MRRQIHIDQELFDSAQSSPNAGWYRLALAQNLMHETAHALGYVHAEPPEGVPPGYRYPEVPFRYLWYEDSQSCIKWP
ncbi:MAG TPA: hypothetical protein VFN22_07110 [Gemmatimonadales bacterium]|nr:hypothetical protein [Gemmatimonadales bacterium]